MTLKVPLIKQENPKNCAIACVAMIMKYYQKGFNQNEFIKKLEVDKYGFSLLDIANFLIKQGFKIEIGHFDQDLLCRSQFSKFPIKLKELERYLSKTRIDKSLKPYLQEDIEFIKKHPKILKIEPVTLQKLDHFLTKKIPVLIHVDVKSYFDKTDDSIHSTLIIGKEKEQYIVLDPLLGKKILPASQLLKAWRNGGGYYLVVLR